MTAETQGQADWTSRRERGAVPAMRAMVWAALRLGRRAVRLLLPPICLYFLLAAPAARQASRAYLARLLGRKPGWGNLYRHYHAFASVVLDRVFLLNDRFHLFRFEIHGEEIVRALADGGEGCLLFGAHLGSFEALRALGRQQPNLRVSMLMYEDNAARINAVLNAINPALALDIVALGRSQSLVAVEQRLNEGHFVGVLADRGLRAGRQRPIPFLGAPAPFPEGPFHMAELLGRPVVLMFGLYRGGARYEIHFERLEAPEIEGAMRAYAARLEHYCRIAPYNWFNFFDFWKP